MSTIPRTFAPLPDCPKFGVGGKKVPKGDIVLLFSSAKVSQISATNADVSSFQSDKKAAAMFQFWLQMVAQTFQKDPSGGGALFFTRVDKATREVRTSNPYSPLTGPHQVDLFVLFTRNQANIFMTDFTMALTPMSERPSKKQRTAPTHELSWKRTTNFMTYVNNIMPTYVNGRYRSHGGEQISEEASCQIPGDDDGVWGDFELDKPTHDSHRAHPFYLYKAEYVIKALRSTLGGSEYDYDVKDFFQRVVQHGAGAGAGPGAGAEGGEREGEGEGEEDGSVDLNRIKLVPSDRIAKAGLVRNFAPTEFFCYFSGTQGVNADTYLDMVPWFSEPSPQQIKKAVQQEYSAQSFSKCYAPEELGVREDDIFHTDYYRLMLHNQAFTADQLEFVRVTFTAKGKFLAADPSRNTPIRASVPDAGGETGLSQLRRRYPVLSVRVEQNTGAMEHAKAVSPLAALSRLRWISTQAFEIAKRGNTDSISPTFNSLYVELGQMSEEISSSGSADQARYKESIFPHDSADMVFEHVTDGQLRYYSPAAWSQLFFVSNCLSHIGATPTQMSMAILYYFAFYRICSHKMDKIVVAFYGDSGTGKSWVTQLAGKCIIRALVVQGGSQSEKAAIYNPVNNDLKWVVTDESPYFPPATGAKTHCKISDDQIATAKTEAESAFIQHAVPVEVMRDDGSSRRETVTMVAITRGGASYGANGPPINENLANRFVNHDVENGNGGSTYAGTLVGAAPARFFQILRYNHTTAQLLCCLINHFVGGPVEIDCTAVNIFIGILDEFGSERYGIIVPRARRREDLRKLSEAACFDEVAKVVAGVHGGDRGRESVERSDEQLAELAVKCACNLVVSSQNVVSAYVETPLLTRNHNKRDPLTRTLCLPPPPGTLPSTRFTCSRLSSWSRPKSLGACKFCGKARTTLEESCTAPPLGRRKLIIRGERASASGA